MEYKKEKEAPAAIDPSRNVRGFTRNLTERERIEEQSPDEK